MFKIYYPINRLFKLNGFMRHIILSMENNFDNVQNSKSPDINQNSIYFPAYDVQTSVND